jgi:hypothetical protein
MEVYRFKTVINNATFVGIKLVDNEKGTEHMFSIAWNKIKGDRWNRRNDQKKAKFFSIGKDEWISGTQQYGLYIGRLGIAFLKAPLNTEKIVH